MGPATGARGIRTDGAPATTEGRSFVACLRVLTTCCGTPAQPDLRNCILFLEDIDERPYAIDRDLWQLLHAGVLSGIRGMVVSNFPGERPLHDRGPDLAALWRDWAGRLGVPLVMGLPFGHEADALSLPSGRPTTLSVAAHGDWQLRFAER
jgi:muramoyltetrapeptide carboxypeptidase